MSLVWLALLGPAFAQVPPEDPDAPMEPAAPTMSDEEKGQLFAKVAAAAASGNREEAARALVAIVEDPTKSPAHGQAWAMLADNLEAFDLELAAVVAWGKAIEGAPALAGPKVGHALDLAEKVGEDAPISEALGKNVGVPVPDDVRNRLAYVAGRYQLASEEYGLALGILMMGNKDQPGFEDVELLRGVVLSQQERYGEAVAPMLTAQALATQVGRDARFLNRANLNVARAYYASGNYGQAINYYAKVDRGSEVWLDAQFERAWAHFRGNDTNGALAMLFNHQAPFFDDYYYPEAHLLRAYSLFVMCKFPEASKEIDAFQARWEPVKAEVAAVSMTPSEAFADVQAFRQGSSTRIPAYLLRSFRYDDRISDAIKAVKHADEELQRAESMGGSVGQLAARLIREQQDNRVRIEGQRIIDRVEHARSELEEMLTGIEITRLDLLSLETQMYERAAATGVLDYGDHIGKLRDMRKKRKGYRVWPWQGEYWADEVGWYVFGARPDCPESMAIGEEAKE